MSSLYILLSPYLSVAPEYTGYVCSLPQSSTLQSTYACSLCLALSVPHFLLVTHRLPQTGVAKIPFCHIHSIYQSILSSPFILYQLHSSIVPAIFTKNMEPCPQMPVLVIFLAFFSLGSETYQPSCRHYSNMHNPNNWHCTDMHGPTCWHRNNAHKTCAPPLHRCAQPHTLTLLWPIQACSLPLHWHVHAPSCTTLHAATTMIHTSSLATITLTLTSPLLVIALTCMACILYHYLQNQHTLPYSL